MDILVREALNNYRKHGDPVAAAALCRAMDMAALMPDSRPYEGGHVMTCNLDDLGNATAHIEIGPTRLLLFHKTVVAVQTLGHPAIFNPDPICRSATTRLRIRNWLYARYAADHRALGDDCVSGEDFNDLIRFKPA